MNDTTTMSMEAGGAMRRIQREDSPRIFLSPLGGWDAIAAPATLAGRKSLLICPSGVLYDDTLWWRWLLQLTTRMGLHTHRDAFWQVWRRDYYDAVCQGERTYWDALQHFLLAAGLGRGQIDEICAAGRPRWRLFDEQLRPFPHVPTALSALQQAGYAINVLAHSPELGNRLAKRYEQMGIGGHVQAVVTSRDLACGPGDANYVSQALAQLNLLAGETILAAHESLQLKREQATNLALASIAVEPTDGEPWQWHFECLDELAAALLSPADQRVA